MAGVNAGTCSKRVCRVAVIGAGASGLVTARELIREGHDVVVFEQQSQLGGIWLYTDDVDSDLFGKDPSRVRVHSSMYQGLTTNLPREIMGFSDFAFAAANMAGRSIDARRYPCSEEVRRYLEAFAHQYQLVSLIRFNARVLQATPVAACYQADIPWQRWVVEWDAAQPGSSSNSIDALSSIARPEPVAATAAAAAAGTAVSSDREAADTAASTTCKEEFDAVLVCNGHYSEPHLPDIPGAREFPGVLLHSHNYRSAERFTGQHVAVVGASFSGLDVARLVAEKAACVYVCAREWKTQKDLDKGGAAFAERSNIQRRGMIRQLTKSGAAEFVVGASVSQLDAVICCSGYNYYFPFLDTKALGLCTAEQHVEPLYQHMFAAGYGPGLAFIGLPWRVVPFPLFELQAKLCARLLSGRACLPPPSEISAWTQQHKQQLHAEGLPPSYSHYLDYKQLQYHAWLAATCGPDVPRVPSWHAAVLHAYWLWRWLVVVGLASVLGKAKQQQQQQQQNNKDVQTPVAAATGLKVAAALAAAAAAIGLAVQRWQ